MKNPWGDPCPNILSKNFLFEKLTNHISFDAVLDADSKNDVFIE